MLEAPGGWPDRVIVLVNEDDPTLDEYRALERELRLEADSQRVPRRGCPWFVVPIPAGSRCSDAHRFITTKFADDAFFGLLCDDQFPITPGWDKALVDAAGARFISTPAGEPHFPLLRNALVLGGDLVRAMGTLVPAPVKHNYEDNIWDRIAADFNILCPLVDVIVEHRHWIHGTAKRDATYERGSYDIEEDRKVYETWLGSADRMKLCERIGELLEIKSILTLDPKTIQLAIVVPIGDEFVDIAYHKSLNATIIECAKSGINLTIIEACGGSHVGKSRERVLWQAMRSVPKPTHLFWVDTDMGWQPKQLLRLLCADHEFAAIAGVRKTDEMKVCCNFFEKEERHPLTDFLKVRDVGFAFVLLKVNVIEKLCEAYPALRYNAGDNAEWALFLDMIDKKSTVNGRYGERLSEDFSFCHRWRTIGGEIWCDDEAAIIHAGRKEYTGRAADVLPSHYPSAAQKTASGA
jgi:hypothetical protein